MQNYHRHSHVSNIILPDSVATNEDYARRAVQLGHTILSSCQHGTPGRYRECAQLAAKYGLKWRYVAEAYFVKDRHEQDRTNCHIILAAKTQKGIGDINEVLSQANVSGYYFRPRVDLQLLMTLDPQDVFVTTACVAGVWAYGKQDDGQYDFTEPDKIVEQLYEHFGRNSFMLEVQNHNTSLQKKLNLHILGLHRKLKIKYICGLDSHYIYEDDAVLRSQLLESGHLKYQDEDGWYMDYPDDATVLKRFAEQGVLTREQAIEAMANTEVFLKFEDITFSREKKLPSVDLELTQEERNDKYRKCVYNAWNKYKTTVPPDQWQKYEQAIEYEVNTITSTNTSDYFLVTKAVVDHAIQLGGMITKTGRGSGVSYFTNFLLGFTSIDRLQIPVTMYPDRFISAARLASGSLPDLDLNSGNPKVFLQAAQDIMGEDHCLPMVSFQTLKRSAAWKMYCRATEVPFEIANAISSSLKEYEMDLKYADEDEADSIDVYEYVPAEYHEHLRMSDKYLGIITVPIQHPCAHMICNQSIKREFGIFRLNSKAGVVYTAFIEGAVADAYGYLKEDFLKVDVVAVNKAIYDRIGIKQPSVGQLLTMTRNDKPTWDVYARGLTIGVNQCEKPKSTEKIMRYKPRNISQMSAFVAGIRPGFKSMVNTLLDRKRFEYGIHALDMLLQTEEMRDSFPLYQQQIMSILQWGGFAASESYAAIKAIAKKHPEKVKPLKSRFIENFARRLVEEQGLTEQAAQENTLTVWKVIEDNTNYSFNASHSVAVALDSLYTAWAKAHYPLETYAVLLQNYAAKGDKDKIEIARREMSRGFHINMAPSKFRQDNRSFFIDRQKNAISSALTSIKGVGLKDAAALYELKDNKYDTFVDLLIDIKGVKGALNAGVMDTLIMCNYFSEFGSIGKLLKMRSEVYDGKNKYEEKHKDKTKEKRIAALREMWAAMPQADVDPYDMLGFELQKFGSPQHVYTDKVKYYVITDVDDKYSPKLSCYHIATGVTGLLKMKKQDYLSMGLKQGLVIHVFKLDKKQAYKFIDGKSEKVPGVYQYWISDCQIVKDLTVKDKK